MYEMVFIQELNPYFEIVTTSENTNLLSTPEKNAVNSRTFYSNDCFSISGETLCTMTLAH